MAQFLKCFELNDVFKVRFFVVSYHLFNYICFVLITFLSGDHDGTEAAFSNFLLYVVVPHDWNHLLILILIVIVIHVLYANLFEKLVGDLCLLVVILFLGRAQTEAGEDGPRGGAVYHTTLLATS